jgi:glycosyltransferase involved in cell wall biosynthesis
VRHYHAAAVHLGLALLTVVPGRMGGSESYVRALLEQYRRGNGPARVTVLANRRVMAAYARYAGDGVSLRLVRAPGAAENAILRAAGMVAVQVFPAPIARQLPRDLDLVHFAATVPVPRTWTPNVVTLFDVQHHDMPDFFPAPERALRAVTYDRGARRAARVITASRYSAGRIVDALGIHPGRVEVVPLGIDHERFRPEGHDDRTLLEPLQLPRRFLLFPANLWPHKNHGRLLEALARAGERDLNLVLTGRTYGRLPALMEQARSLGLSERVRHLGYIPSEAVPALYRAATALVFPSLYEGFGSPPLEAMACGCPVASSTRTSLAEACGAAALRLEPESVESMAESIRRIVGDEPLRAELRRSGLERAGRFQWELVARRHVEIYESVSATSGAAEDP